MKRSKNSVVIKTQTWTKDSNELFDYECPDLVKNTLTVNSEGFLIRTKDEINFIKEEKEINNEKAILKLSIKEDGFNVACNFEEKNTLETPWVSLRHLKSKTKPNGYVLNVGDIVKLGRIRLKIREINLKSVDLGETRKDIQQELNTFYGKKTDKEEGLIPTSVPKSKRVCRVCYCDEREVDSPLLNPCNCSGGVKYIHFSCLQQWLKSKCITRSISTENCMIYTVKQMECEICKSVLPDIVKTKEKLYEIYEFIKPPFKNFMAIETVTTNPLLKNMYIINLDNKDTVKIGRSHDSDLRITDISVSRFHAQITRYSDNTLRIEDNNSKFGSLVLVQMKSIPLVISPSLPLQIGRTVILACIKPPWRLFSCFSCNAQPHREADYTRLNTGHIEVEKVLSVKLQNDNDDCEESDGVVSVNKKIEIEKDYNMDVISHGNILTSNNDIDEEEEVNGVFSSHLNDDVIIVRNGQVKSHRDHLDCIESDAEGIIKIEQLDKPDNLNSVRVINGSRDLTSNINSHSQNILNDFQNNQHIQNFNNVNNPNYVEEEITLKINTEKKAINMKRGSNFNTIVGTYMNSDLSRQPNATGLQKFEKLSRVEKVAGYNDDSILNINYTSVRPQPKKMRNSGSPVKLNLDAFKKYEEDERKDKNEFQIAVQGYTLSQRNEDSQKINMRRSLQS